MNRDDDPWAAFIGRLGEAEMGPSSSGLGQLFCYPFEAADKKMSSTDLHTLQDWMNLRRACCAPHKAHARREFMELHAANKSTIAATAIDFSGQLYGIEREIKELRPEQEAAKQGPVARNRKGPALLIKTVKPYQSRKVRSPQLAMFFPSALEAEFVHIPRPGTSHSMRHMEPGKSYRWSQHRLVVGSP
ncbi:transposase [Variovorax sp. LjRoot290]|uniref:IS66 family transposase n=1 Tax=unclassified Variovorax TaxID=663243 RepID=UPI003ECF4541